VATAWGRSHARAQPRRSFGQVLKDFWRKAYTDNVTGLSAMVAYNLLLSVFPLALLSLFIAGKLLKSQQLEASVLQDLRHLFPRVDEKSLKSLLNTVRSSSTGLGIGALVSSIWIGSSFWGSLDTAFCRIYHVRCRGWLEQKRFSLAMLVVVLLFMGASVIIPTLQSILVGGAQNLPFGLEHLHDIVYVASFVAGMVILFGILCVIFWAVPNRIVPWRALWPGALGATVAIGAIDVAFPVYVTHISTLANVRASLIFTLIVLIWFYAIAIILLAAAVINATRFELHDTGELNIDQR
jgi:YihY family inner membrane protein